MMNDDATMCRQIFQKSMCSSIQVVSSNDFVARSQLARYNVEGTHARGNDQGSLRAHDFRKVLFEVCAGGITTAGVVIVGDSTCGRGLLECSGLLTWLARFSRFRRVTTNLVDWHAAGVVLVIAFGEDQLGRKCIIAAASWARRCR